VNQPLPLNGDRHPDAPGHPPTSTPAATPSITGIRPRSRQQPYGDSIGIDTTYHAPTFWTSQPTCCSRVTSRPFPSTHEQGYLDYAATINARPYDSSSAFKTASVAGMSMIVTADPANGGTSFQYYDTSLGQEVFTQRITFLDDNGNITTPRTSDSSIQRLPQFQLDLNINVTFTAPEFHGREIDLILAAGFFETFEFIQFPIGYMATLPCNEENR